MYLDAENASVEDGQYELHISQNGASVIYGGGYEDRYQIVEYEQNEQR